MSICVAVLTVSDTASADESQDKSGPTVRDLVSEHGYECKYMTVVPDDEDKIYSAVRGWCEQGDIDLIITTGGTGLGVRDRTPEAVSSLIDRQAPGLVHLMLSTSLKHTPLAALSRLVAGTISNTLIVTLPGSPKAVKEIIDALLSGGIIDHAVDLLKGGTGKSVHTVLRSTSFAPVDNEAHSDLRNHAQHHHHHYYRSAPISRTVLSHDPASAPSSRNRVSPYPLISFESAISHILTECHPLEIVRRPVTADLKGHVLAEDVFAPRDVPSSNTTSVDGYALRSTDDAGIYRVLTSQTHILSDTIPKGSIYRINTGAPLPEGADTVIMVEDTHLVSTLKDDQGNDIEEMDVETHVKLPPGENVRVPGSDVAKGELTLKKYEILHSVGGEIGTLAFVGRKEVDVFRKPVVALFSTGNEILDIQTPMPVRYEGWGGIWDTNRPSLQAALEGMGYEILDLGVVPDEISALVQAIKTGLGQADLILTTGGTSMGPADLLKPIIERNFNGIIHFGRVTVKPGKPTTFATIPTQSGRRMPVLALPGNPASAIVTYHLFVVPALRKMGGWPNERCQLPRVPVRLQENMKLDDRNEFHRVVIRSTPQGFIASSTGGQRSSRVSSLSGANGLVALPPRRRDGPQMLQAGEFANAVVIGEIYM